jgi:hypothetical protein
LGAFRALSVNVQRIQSFPTCSIFRLGMSLFKSRQGGIIMTAQLRLAYTNTEHLIEQVQSGGVQLAHGQAVSENLDPFGVAIVSNWMSRAGLCEEQILEVMVGHAAAMESAKAALLPRKRHPHA